MIVHRWSTVYLAQLSVLRNHKEQNRKTVHLSQQQEQAINNKTEKGNCINIDLNDIRKVDDEEVN